MNTEPRPVCVITGGGGGIGRAVAPAMSTHRIILAGRTQHMLRSAALELRGEGLDVLIFSCDVTDATAVGGLARIATELGRWEPSSTLLQYRTTWETPPRCSVSTPSAPHMHTAFAPVLRPGGRLIDVSSVAARLVPSDVLPREAYPLALTAPEEFIATPDATFGRLGELASLIAHCADPGAVNLTGTDILCDAVAGPCAA